MSIESVILSKEGYSEIERFCKFLGSIIVKNEAEAIRNETKSSFNNFFLYESAYKKVKNIYDLDYTIDDLRTFFTDKEISMYELTVPENLSNILNSTVSSQASVKLKIENMITQKQNEIVKKYNELNPYYRSFLGLPPTKNDIILIPNLDMDISPTEGGMIELHNLDYEKYPSTYEFYFVKLFINELLEEQETLNKSRDNPKDLTYARFIEKRLTPFYVRKAPDFTLLYYEKNILSDEEFKQFEKAFNKARIYVIEILYITGLRDRYEMYPLIMLQLLLTATFMNYYNLNLYNYSVKNLTRNDLYDILESEGLSDLKQINDISILRKVVDNLDLLNKYKGSQQALQILFNVLKDETLTVRSYKLKKRYNTDTDLNLKYKGNYFYDKSVDIIFEENVEIKGKDSTDVTRTVNYDEFVKNDDLWGGVSKNSTYDVKTQIKKDMKNKILQMSFDTLDTKYISLAKTFNLYEKSNEINSVYYMVFKTCYDSADVLGYNPLTDTELLFDDNIEVKPIELWAAQCLFSSFLSGLTEPDIIRPDLACFSSVFALRSNSGLLSFIKKFGQNNAANELNITDSTITKPIADILGIDLIRKFLIKYNLNAQTSAIELIDEFGTNLDVMYELADYMVSNMGTMAEREALYKLWDINEISYNYNYIYEGHESFSSFLIAKNPTFYTWIQEILAKARMPHNNAKEIYLNAQKEVLNTFKSFMNDYLQGRYDISLEASGNDLSYMNDLKILFKEYLSIYLELYNVEQIFDISNIPRNLCRCYFSEGEKIVYNELLDTVGTRIRNRMHQVSNQLSDFSLTNMLTHELNFNVKSENEDPDLPPSEMRNSFKIDILIDLLRLELKTYFTDTVTELRVIENLRRVSHYYVDNMKPFDFVLTVASIFNDLGVFKGSLDLTFERKTIDLIFNFVSSVALVAKQIKFEVQKRFETTIKIDDKLIIKTMEN